MSLDSTSPRADAQHSSEDDARTRHFLTSMSRDLGIAPQVLEEAHFVDSGDLPSVFAVSDLATAAVAVAGTAVAELVNAKFGLSPRVCVNRRLSSLWFGSSIRPDGWALPPAWDPVAGDYPTADGWIRLHTNAPHHREAALSVLGVPPERSDVARAVARWNAEELEAAVIASNGCAAAMRTTAAWAAHPQGEGVSQEPLVTVNATDDCGDPEWSSTPDRPMQGVRVLDLTRVLAGPVATRFLAGFGAEVLRIDPPGWDEPGVVPEVTVGKRCARLDLRNSSDRKIFEQLLRRADVLVHGYRADALARLGLDTRTRRKIRPGLVDVSLNAYGWRGPWRNRRGFDSLVQMSAGIAEAGMRVLGRDRPTPLPVQALDHATGYLMAAAVVRGLTQRISGGQGFEARMSLARMAHLLISGPAGKASRNWEAATAGEWSEHIEATAFGPARRLRSPLVIGDATLRWDGPAVKLGSSAPAW